MCATIFMTGEVGGKLLACYLHSVQEKESAAFISKAGGIKAWLEKQLPKYNGPIQFPAQKLCIEHAIKYVPKLVAGLAEASQTVPEPDFSSDDDTPPSPTF